MTSALSACRGNIAVIRFTSCHTPPRNASRVRLIPAGEFPIHAPLLQVFLQSATRVILPFLNALNAASDLTVRYYYHAPMSYLIDVPLPILRDDACILGVGANSTMLEGATQAPLLKDSEHRRWIHGQLWLLRNLDNCARAYASCCWALPGLVG